jgi:hypothetical protein
LHTAPQTTVPPHCSAPRARAASEAAALSQDASTNKGGVTSSSLEVRVGPLGL